MNAEELKKQLEESKISENDLYGEIRKLDSDSKKTLLYDTKFIKEKLQMLEIINCICEVEADSDKLELGKLYEVDDTLMYNIVMSLSDEGKKKIIIENPYNYSDYNMMKLISTIDAETLVDIFKNNQELLKKQGMKPYEIVRKLSTEKQLKFISMIDNTGLSLSEKRKIFVYLNAETKQKIDKAKLPYEYKTAIEMQIGEDFKDYSALDKIILDLDKDIEIYRGLDELITVNALTIKEEDREKLLKLCEICPNMKITDNMIIGISSAEEYKNAEKWIETIIQKVDENWTDIEKIAFVDSMVGKKISYTPDYGTEVCDQGAARALWKIIDSGYGE